MKLKFVFRRDNSLIRILRLMWINGKVGDGKGYSSKISVAIQPVLFKFKKEWDGFFLTLLGIRLHYQKSFGGIHT